MGKGGEGKGEGKERERRVAPPPNCGVWIRQCMHALLLSDYQLAVCLHYGSLANKTRERKKERERERERERAVTVLLVCSTLCLSSLSHVLSVDQTVILANYCS